MWGWRTFGDRDSHGIRCEESDGSQLQRREEKHLLLWGSIMNEARAKTLWHLKMKSTICYPVLDFKGLTYELRFRRRYSSGLLVEAGNTWTPSGSKGGRAWITTATWEPLLNAIFRGFHTVKGGAGFLTELELVDTCHGAENVFDVSTRNGQRSVTSRFDGHDATGSRYS